MKDISTIVSIVPVEIREFKPGIFPGQFNIPACDNPDKPVFYPVSSSVTMFSVAGQKNPVPVETSSAIIASAICRDYNVSQIALGNDSAPGLAFVEGKCDLTSLTAEHPEVLPALKASQRVWYINLCKMADNDWERYKNHKAISTLEKIACRALKLDRDWLLDEYSAETLSKCKACEQQISRTQVICHHCRCIQDIDRATKSGIKFAA